MSNDRCDEAADAAQTPLDVGAEAAHGVDAEAAHGVGAEVAHAVGAEAARGHAVFPTVIGHCGIAWKRGALVGVLLPEDCEEATRARMRRLHSQLPETTIERAPAFVRRSIGRIAAMLRGEPDDLRDLPLDMTVVPAFHRRVYALVRDIPPGHTLTYGEVAARLGDPTAARAVGQALGRNPFAPVIPCHRVLASGSRAGGFSAGGGIDTKLRMLQAEGARMSREPGLFDGDPAAYR